MTTAARAWYSARASVELPWMHVGTQHTWDRNGWKAIRWLSQKPHRTLCLKQHLGVGFGTALRLHGEATGFFCFGTTRQLGGFLCCWSWYHILGPLSMSYMVGCNLQSLCYIRFLLTRMFRSTIHLSIAGSHGYGMAHLPNIHEAPSWITSNVAPPDASANLWAWNRFF